MLKRTGFGTDDDRPCPRNGGTDGKRGDPVRSPIPRRDGHGGKGSAAQGTDPLGHGGRGACHL